MLHHARRCIQMNLNHSLTSSLTHSWSRAVTLSTVASFDMFNPTHEHKMLRTTIRDFIEKEVDPQALASNRYHTLRSTYCIWICCHSSVHVLSQYTRMSSRCTIVWLYIIAHDACIVCTSRIVLCYGSNNERSKVVWVLFLGTKYSIQNCSAGVQKWVC